MLQAAARTTAIAKCKTNLGQNESKLFLIRNLSLALSLSVFPSLAVYLFRWQVEQRMLATATAATLLLLLVLLLWQLLAQCKYNYRQQLAHILQQASAAAHVAQDTYRLSVEAISLLTNTHKHTRTHTTPRTLLNSNADYPYEYVKWQANAAYVRYDELLH